MKKKYSILFLFYLIVCTAYSQGSPTCAGANAICSGGLTFDNTTGAPSAESGIDYDCLFSEPNPTWFFLKIGTSGNLDFEISQYNTAGAGIDVDFIAWGPFTTPSCGVANLNSSTEVACSYSIAPIEAFTINNAITGQYYMLLITNFSDEAGHITLTQTNATNSPTPGIGSTDCDIVCPLSITGGGVPVCSGTTLTAVYVNSTAPTFQWYLNGVIIPGATSITYVPTISGTYSVIANSPGCVPNQTTSTIVPDPTPVPIQPPINPLTTCTSTTFNLTANTPVILSGLNAADYDVNYHTTLAGAQNVDGSIPTPTAYPGTNGQTIYISIQDFANGGCVTTSQFTLSFVSCVLTATNTAPICTGSGTFNLNASNPGAGYTYSWTGPNGFTSNSQNPTNVPEPTGVPPFIYTVTATGSSTYNASTTVIINSLPTVTVNSPVICSGSSATVTATPDSAGTYSYVWTVPAGVTAPGNIASFTTTVAGTYSVIITNTATMCVSVSVSGNVTVAPKPTVTVNNATICSGDVATITASPASPGTYSYVWTVPAGVTDPGNVASFTTTTVGTYSVVITDTTTTCSSSSASGTVSQSSAGGSMNLQCGAYNSAGHSGEIYIDWSNVPGITTFNYSYSIGGGAVVTGTQAAPSSIYILTNGVPITFTLSGVGSVCVPTQTITCGCPNPMINSITDIVSCSSSVVNQINFSTSDAYDSVSWTNDNPSIGLAASGTGNFIPSFTASSTATTQFATITVVLTKYGCAGTPRTFKITINPLPTATISGTATKCIGTTASIVFNGTPNATVSYTVDGGSIQTAVLNASGTITVTTPVLTNNTIYTLVSVAVSGSSSCAQSQPGTAVITVIPSPTVNVNSQTVCSGSNVTVIATPGSPGTYSYVWTIPAGAIPPGNVSSFTTTVSGTYSVIITDSVSLCSSTSASGIINVFPQPTVTVNSPIICNGGTTTIIATPGTSDVYSYAWTVPIGVPAPGNIASFNTTVVGTYSVIVTNMTTLCISNSASGTITISPTATVVATTNNPIICSGENTHIDLTSNLGGTTFSWTASQTGVFGTSSGNGNIIEQALTTVGLVSGTVTYTITPINNGCEGTPTTVTITVNPVPEVFGTSGNIICSGDSTNIVLSPNIPGTNFTWTVIQNNVTGASNAGGNAINQTLETTGTALGQVFYTITPEYNGCYGKPIMIVISVNPAPIPRLEDGIICVNQDTGVAFQTYTLDTELSNSFHFDWTLDGVIIPGVSTHTYTATQAGQYGVIATDNVTGCTSKQYYANVIPSFPGEIISINHSFAFSDNATITVQISGSGIYEYQLDNGSFQSSNVFTNVSSGSHNVFVRDTNGCTDIGPIAVSIIDYPHYFTPNGDGIHDTWNITGLDSPSLISIFDRQGKLLKQISTTGSGWDGNYNERQLPSSDYWFTIDYVEDGVSKTFKSHFSMKR